MSDSDTSTDEDENNEPDNTDHSNSGKVMCGAKLVRNHAMYVSLDLQDSIIIDNPESVLEVITALRGSTL
jgi:hypothetical protein